MHRLPDQLTFLVSSCKSGRKYFHTKMMATIFVTILAANCGAVYSPPKAAHLWRRLTNQNSTNRFSPPNVVKTREDSSPVDWFSSLEIVSMNQTTKMTDHQSIVQIPNIRKVSNHPTDPVPTQPIQWYDEEYANLNGCVYVKPECYVTEICCGSLMLIGSMILLILAFTTGIFNSK